MRYVMRQKLISLGDDFTIRDADGRDAYFVDGKALTLRDRLTFQDMDGRELLSIQRRLLAWGPTYEIHQGDQLKAVVKQKLFTLFNQRFSVDEIDREDDLTAKGNFTDHHYTFSRGGREVAWVSEKWFSLADTYGVEVGAGEDPVLILACAVVIDRCQEAAERRD
ncbi:MAG TPA: LURP-one-related family protein [Tepidisphaeraceae bacterium]|nr:LURP-one-related family protein [Tepidisphaeraceae bacterium]